MDRRPLMLLVRAAAALATLAVLAPGAAAQTLSATAAVPANRLVPALGPGSFAGIEGAATTPAGDLSWTAALGLVRDPITLRRAYGDGALVARPVRDQLVADVGFELGVWRRLAVAVAAPVVLYQDGTRLGGLGVDEATLATTVAGDVRLRLKALLAGVAARPGAHVGASLQVTAPGGGQHDFAAQSGATVEPRLVADWRNQRLAVAVTLGARFAGERNLFGTRIGDELLWGAAAALTVLSRPRAHLEALFEAEGGVGAAAGTRPAELRGAVRVAAGSFALDAGAGGGVDHDLGAPAWRLFVIARSRLPLTR